MNAISLKALLGLVPASLLLAGSLILLLKRRTTGSVLQLLGAGCLLLVILAHLCEGLHLFPAMGWGSNTAPDIIWTCAARFCRFCCFPSASCFTLWQREIPGARVSLFGWDPYVPGDTNLRKG